MPSLSSQNNVKILVESQADNSGINESEQGLENLDRSIQKNNKSSNIFTDNLGKAAIAATGLVASIGAVTIGALNQASAYQQNRVSFETMLGSADKARSLLKEVSDFAAQTPFELPQVVEGAKNLLAFGISAQDIIPTFTMLGNIAAGIGTDKLPNLIAVFGQVRAAGRLMSQDLLQLTSAGIPILDLLAQHFGTTSDKIKDMIETGQVKFSDLQASLELLGGPSGRWGDLMAKQSQTFNGTLSNLSDNLGRVLRGVIGISPDGDVRKGSFFDISIKAANQLLTVVNNLAPKITAVAVYFENNKVAAAMLAGALGGLVVLIGVGLVGVLGGLAAILGTIAGLLMFSGVGAAAVGLGILLYRLRDHFSGVITIASQFWTALKDYLGPVLQWLGHVIMTTLWPSLQQLWVSLQNLWTIIGPVVLPALRIFAETLGVTIIFALMALIGAIGLLVKILATLINITSQVINTFVAFRNGIDGVGYSFNRLSGPAKTAFAIVNAAIGSAMGPIGNVLGGLTGIINLVQNVSRALSSLSAGKSPTAALHALHVPGFASGVQNFSGGLAVVGEKGPELVDLPSGSNVIPNHQIGRSQSVQIGAVYLGNAPAVDRFFGNLDQDTINLGKGLTPTRGAY